MLSAKPAHVGDRPGQEVDQVEAVRREVEEQPRAGVRRVESPVRGGGAGGEPVGDLNVDGGEPADGARREALADGEEARQRPPVVRDPERDAARRGRRRSSARTRRGFVAIGFSTRQGLPAAAASRASASCVPGGVAM